MSNQLLTGINSALSKQVGITNNLLDNFDLSDSTFSNILDNKLENTDQKENNTNNILEKLGMPVGLNIEGFDYVSETQKNNEINAVNTDSNINSNSEFDIKSFISDAAESFGPVVNTAMKVGFGINPETVSNTAKAVKNFWQNQAANFYSIMNKDNVTDISELISKL